jgi:predicted amidohydrolase YtcJ
MLSPEESISIIDALKLYTINGAFANGVEKTLGTLSPGKLADIVVLNENPLEINPAKLKDIKVSKTFINGVEVYNESNPN